jgi:hypothetical protein
MAMAVSLVTGGGVSAELSGAISGTAGDVDKNVNKQESHSKDMQQGAGQPSEQPKAMDQSANQQGKQQEKASQADLEEGKTAKAVDELEQQKSSN